MPRLVAHLCFVAALWAALGWESPAYAQAELPSAVVTVRDGLFNPAQLNVPAGGRFKLVLKNEGPGPLEFENDDMHLEKIVAAGAQSFVVLPPLTPGSYEFIDEFNIATGLLLIVAQ